jgi:hypothetical protein
MRTAGRDSPVELRGARALIELCGATAAAEQRGQQDGIPRRVRAGLVDISAQAAGTTNQLGCDALQS